MVEREGKGERGGNENSSFFPTPSLCPTVVFLLFPVSYLLHNPPLGLLEFMVASVKGLTVC